MKHIYYIVLLMAAVAGACQSSDNYGELPRPVAQFVSRYWPDPDIESYTMPSAGKYVVVIRNSATLTFGPDYSWTEINGNGLPLPEVLVYDQLPAKVYEYILTASAASSVFVIGRTPRSYTVTLLDSTVEYDIGSGTISQR